MRNKGWQQGLNKDATQRGMKPPEKGEVCDFEKTRSRMKRDSDTILRMLEASLEQVDPSEARLILSVRSWSDDCGTPVLVNLQANRLGERWPDTAGGTPNDTFRLPRDRYSYLARARITAGAGRVAVELDAMQQERAIGARDDLTTWGRSGRIGGMA